jgi:hypothetical protein
LTSSVAFLFLLYFSAVLSFFCNSHCFSSLLLFCI